MQEVVAWSSVLPTAWQCIALLFKGCTALVLAVVAIDSFIRWRNPERTARQGSALYSGKVWHSRYKPAEHSFKYPIFFSFIDLDELQQVFPWYLWPLAGCGRLPALAKFADADHLKDKPESRGKPLAERVRDLVEAATGQRPLGPVRLLTHLSYFGYCFNPVSFYYCYHESGSKVQAIVGEVSNTPWMEMHCYVLGVGAPGVEVIPPLHPEVSKTVRYKFQKAFHVSPFMDMDHLYDWSFSAPGEELTATNAMLKKSEQWFQARIALRRAPFTAASLLWHLLRYPAYTAVLQVLIHWQALFLWAKKVPFYPHPDATETAVSRAIAAVMRPLWAVQARFSSPSEEEVLRAEAAVRSVKADAAAASAAAASAGAAASSSSVTAEKSKDV
jgi:uncharacterized protein